MSKFANHLKVYTGDVFIKEFNNGFKDGDMLVGSTVDGNSYNHCEFVYKGSNTKKRSLRSFWMGGSKKSNKVSSKFFYSR